MAQVKAQDDDKNLHAQVLYRLVKSGIGSRDAAFFRIDSNTGVINTRRRLDRESQELYHLQVEARDKGTPSLSSTTRVTVIVEDVNDNAPVFRKPNTKHNVSLRVET